MKGTQPNRAIEVRQSKVTTKDVKKPIEFATKETKLSNYIINNQIGQGAYAIVKQAINKITKEKVAIKIYEKFKITDGQRKASVNREISLLKRLCHPHIVKLYETIDTHRQLYLIMELALGRSLHTYVRSKATRKLPEKDALKIFRQLISAIEYCHKQNVTHRDIKMENILIDDNLNVKLIDFGFSICAASTQRLKVFCGTPSYMAPEIVNKKEYLGPPTDIWSLGILFYTLLIGHYPFRGMSERELFQNITKGVITYSVEISSEARKVIEKMLQVDPEKRATAAEVICCVRVDNERSYYE